MSGATFDPGDGSRLPYFFHPHNCGVKASRRRTERTVELPIAGRWLAARDPANVVEIGAVTPYYWPGRVGRVVDPADAKATERASLFEARIADRDVLSISTIEHIGERRYGLAESRTPLEALGLLVMLASRLLITFPTGLTYPGAADMERFVWSEKETALKRMGVSVRLLARNADETWAPAERPLPYGDRRNRWANAVIVLER